MILVAALGYLYVRLSKASSGYIWGANDIAIEYNVGSRVTKQGRPAIQSVQLRGTDQDSMQIAVNSNVDSPDVYCVEGYSTKGFEGHLGWRIGTTSTETPASKQMIPAGNFTQCLDVPVTRGSSRYVYYFASRARVTDYGTIWVYSMYRKGVQSAPTPTPSVIKNRQ